jgi:hypothetical protein
LTFPTSKIGIEQIKFSQSVFMASDISEAQQQRNDRIILWALNCLTLLWQGNPEFYPLACEQLPKRNLVQIWQEELNPDRNGGDNAFTIEGSRFYQTGSRFNPPRACCLYLVLFAKGCFFLVGKPYK